MKNYSIVTITILISLMVVVALDVKGVCNPTFTLAQTLGTSDGEAVALGDLNGDGKADAVVANDNIPNGQANKVYLSNASGQLIDSGQSLGAEVSTDLVLGDIDGDGDLDAYVANGHPFIALDNEIWKNNGAGSFSYSTHASSDGTTQGCDLGDIDDDGDLDLVIVNYSGPGGLERISLFKNNGAGFFSLNNEFVEDKAFADARLGDLDGDNDLDLFIGLAFGQGDRIYLNNSGVFNNTGQSLGNENTFDVELADVDNDGDLDAISGGKVWLNNGSASFSDSGQDINYSYDIAAADLDFDGDVDLVGVDGNAYIFLNDGFGIFTNSPPSLLSSADANGVDIGDINGDGFPDIYLAVDGGADEVYLHDTCPLSIIDFTPTNLIFTAEVNEASPAPQSCVISNRGNTSFSYTVTTVYGAGASGWLSITSTSGTVAAGATQNHTASINSSGLAEGTYYATNVATSATAINSPQYQTIILTVTPSACDEAVLDFDGDGISDVGTYQPDTGIWKLRRTSQGSTTIQFGYSGTLPIVGDFDGDGTADYAVFDSTSASWTISQSSAPGSPIFTTFGLAGATPITGDFDGDNTDDYGTYYGAIGSWDLFLSGSGAPWNTLFGFSDTIPVSGDFDGDGIMDFGCFYPPTGNWIIYQSQIQDLWTTLFGYTGTVPIRGDFDGDGVLDFGCYFADGGWWYIFQSNNQQLRTIQFGYPGTTPVTGDFDGDCVDDFGCFESANAWWNIYMSSSNDIYTVQFGDPGSIGLRY